MCFNVKHLVSILSFLLVVLLSQATYAQTIIYQDDFEGAVSGWTVNDTDYDNDTTNFLGRFAVGNTTTSRTFVVPAGSDSLEIAFDLYRFDSWDVHLTDRFELVVNGTTFPFTFNAANGSGVNGNIEWSYTRTRGPEQFAFNMGTQDFWREQIFAFEVIVNNPGSSTTLTLFGNLNQNEDDESVGYDNFVVTAFPPPATEITAVSESFSPIDGNAGGATPSVLISDTYDNGPATLSDVSITVLNSSSPNVALNPLTGIITVNPATPTGFYTVEYQICENSDPTNCSTVEETIPVQVSGPGGTFCPVGTSTVPGTYHVLSATGGNQPALAVGAPVAEGTTLFNSAVTFFGPITMDLTGDPAILVPEGEVIEIALSSHFGTQGRAEILMSADGVTYTSLGTTGNGGSVYGAWTSNVIRYDDFTVPAGGARFLQVLHQASGVRTDGVIYDTQCHPSASNPDMSLSKVADNDTNRVAGDTITYTYTVENTGDVNIEDVTISDQHTTSAGTSTLPVSGETGDVGNSANSSDATASDGSWDVLAPGDTVTFTSTYLVTAADIAAGTDITNIATATGTPESGTLTDPTANETVTVASLPADTIQNPQTCGAYSHAGWSTPGGPFANANINFGSGDPQRDPYQYAGLTRDASGKIVSFYGAADHIDNATSGNPARVNLEPHNNATPPYVSEYHRTIYRLDGIPGASDSITFESAGGADNITAWIEDSSGTVIANAPGVGATDDGWVFGTFNNLTLNFTYPADGIAFLNGVLFDPSANYGGTNISGLTCPEPEMTLAKVADNDTNRAVGDIITYTYTVENTGSVNINTISLNDQHTTSAGTSTLPVSGETGDAGNSANSTDATANDGSWDLLAPSDIITFTSTYTVTQADVDSGNPITNIATVTGTPATGAFGPNPITAGESVTVETAAPSLEIDKPAPSNADEDGNSSVSIGDTLTYTITATNTGNTTQNNVTVSDPLITPTTIACATLAPGATCTLTGDYVVTMTDAGGNVVNTASAQSDEVTTPVTDTVTTPVVAAAPSLDIVKSAPTNADEDGSGTVSIGDTLTYTITVTNDGNVDQTNVVVTDNLITPSSNTCATVAVGATCTLTGDYVVTMTDAGGNVVNTASAQSDEVTTPVTDTVTTPVVAAAPSLDIVKSAPTNADEDGSGTVSIGDTLTYTITVTNDGNVDQTNVVVTDNLITPSSNTCATVAVGATCTLTGTYVVQANDTSDTGGNLVNTANAESNEVTTSDTDTVTTAIDPAAPSLSMTKVADDDTLREVGDIITYTYTVTNNGNVAVNDIAITDTHNGSDPAPTPIGETLLTDAAPAGDSTDGTPNDGNWDVLSPGDSVTFTGTYVVTAADAANL